MNRNEINILANRFTDYLKSNKNRSHIKLLFELKVIQSFKKDLAFNRYKYKPFKFNENNLVKLFNDTTLEIIEFADYILELSKSDNLGLIDYYIDLENINVFGFINICSVNVNYKHINGGGIVSSYYFVNINNRKLIYWCDTMDTKETQYQIFKEHL